MISSSNRERKRYFKSFLKTDRAVLLISILIATVAWGIFKLSREYVHTSELNIKYLLSDDYTFTSIPPDKVAAQIRGTGWSLIRFLWSGEMDSIEIVLDGTEEQINASLSVRNQLLKAGLDQLVVPATYPNELRISLSEKLEKKVSVTLVGDPVTSSNYIRKGNIQIIPDSVSVRGPEQLISSFQTWKTDSLNPQPLNKSLNITLNLQPSPNPLVTVSPSSVQVKMEVEPITERQLTVPIEVPDSIKNRIRIFPDQASVTVTTGISRYNELTPSLFTLTANADLHASVRICEVTLQKQPDFAQTVYFSPKEVEFYIMN